ncbi:helix-turn-helix transcriptional regulator [Streptomyces sp. NBC_01485]|uniref:helix-turn-helix domain-containing protein n=1 Tax=Streptomyces sp. NBC_01485 TaxID=2903884 RepID=UPI002E31B812|nr:helix-turn-helix transcriptional regulator [Streptomyces sp. NBC_01485]
MTDATPPLRQRFGAVVLAAAERAGYTGHGRNAKFARATGMTESSVSRMFNGQAIPDPGFFEPIADAAGIHPTVLFVESGLMSRESLQSLSETDRSQVGSALTPEEAADGLGIQGDVDREFFYATVERLKRYEAEDAERRASRGGTAAQM